MSASPVISRYYHGESGAYLEDWGPELTTCEITFGRNGPESAREGVAEGAPCLHHSRCLPAGVGGFSEIDARAAGVPEVWTGRVTLPEFGGDMAGAEFPVLGPESWLVDSGVPLAGVFTAPSADIVRAAFRDSAIQTWTEFVGSSPTTHARIPYQAGGETHWKLMTTLAAQRGEEFYLTARPGMVGFHLQWRHALDSPDLSARVTLVQGVNCQLGKSALNVGLPRSAAVGIALSFGAGADVVASLVQAPPASRTGLFHGLTAALSTLTVRKLAGSGSISEAVPLPEITSQAALDAMVEAMVRRDSVVTGTVQLTDVGQELWPYMRVGALVGARLRDPFGYFESCLLRIRTATFALLPTRSCSVSAELWLREGDQA